MATILLIKYKI